MNHPEKAKEHQKILEEYRVFIDYARANNLDIEGLKKVIKDSIAFYLQILSDKTYRQEVKKEIYNHIRLTPLY